MSAVTPGGLVPFKVLDTLMHVPYMILSYNISQSQVVQNFAQQASSYELVENEYSCF